MSPFEIKDCALLTRMSGLAPALNLRELRDRISICTPDVLYHHFCETPLTPTFDYPDYRNDFAVWARRRLGDHVLAERLGMIDPYVFPSMEELRQFTLEVLDERLSEVSMIPWARQGHAFNFMQAVTVVFDTGNRVHEPHQLPSAIRLMTNGSIYFHVLEARRRDPVGMDDFSAWLQGMEGDWTRYIESILKIDVTFHTLAEIRRELVEAHSGHWDPA
ncbi:MAG: DUF5752 family protein [Thermodesulfobacteriota bacterium]